jgi:aminoglycoside phosphotransferase (APT) family kinase protein
MSLAAGASSVRLVETARAIEAAARVGVAPRVRHVDPETGILITDWAPGPTWREADLARPERLRALARTLRTLHGVNDVSDPFDLRGHVAGYRERIARAPDDRPLARRLDELDRLVDGHVRSRSTRSLGHNDVTVGNIVGDGRPLLVDWEYAAGSDPSFDLATVIALHGLGPTERSTFLDAYDTGSGPPTDRERVAETERLVVLLSWIWARAELLDRPGDERARRWARSLEPRV